MNSRLQDPRVERYVAGRMDPAEAREFRREMEANDELRRQVRIESLTVGVMRDERNGISADHTAARARALDAMARIAPSGSSSAAGSGVAAMNGDRRGGSARTRRAIYAIVGLLAIGAVGWGILSNVDSTDPGEERVSPVPVEMPSAVQDRMPPPETIVPDDRSVPSTSSEAPTIRSPRPRVEGRSGDDRARTSASATSASTDSLVVPDLPASTTTLEARSDSTARESIPETRDLKARSRIILMPPKH